MNFTKILGQLNNIEIKNCQIDQKFMSTSTFQKKYKNKDIYQIKNTINHRKSSDKTVLKPTKHRYFQDIQAEEIEDANIFGYSTFEYFMYFKKNQAKMNLLSKRNKQKQHKKYIPLSRQNKFSQNTDTLNSQNREKSNSFMRPKTAIVSRGTPTKRRIHNKLSLNQAQKAVITEILLPSNMKQPLFTQEIFNFKPSGNLDTKIESIRYGSKTATFYKQQRPQSLYHDDKQKKSHYYFEKQNEKSSKRHVNISCKQKNVCWQQSNIVKLIKGKGRYLGSQKICWTKTNFENCTKKTKQNVATSDVSKSDKLKSIVYERVSNNRKINEELAYYTKEIKQKVLNPRSCSPNQSNVFIINERNSLPSEPSQDSGSQAKQKIPSTISYEIGEPQIKQPQFLKNINPSSDICFFHEINSLLLQTSQLTDIHFQFDSNFTPLHYSALEKIVAQNIKNQINSLLDPKPKSWQNFNPKNLFPKKSKHIQKFYSFIIVNCLTLEWIKIENVELVDEEFWHKGNQINLLMIAQRLMKNKLSSDFIHIMITRKNLKSEKQHDQILVFQTFIHNSDVKYFESREMQIQYFKYFLKRFITFDQSVKKNQQVLASVSLILESEVKTPPEFEEFCREMKIKGDLKILALKNLETKNQEITFKSIEISLSKLLKDAIETVMMVKKEFFQGYDWRGVSLTKGAKQYRGYHLEHFYI